jgi:hypothetical protein
MRHRQACCDDLPASHVKDDAAIAPFAAPTLKDIGARQAGYISGLASLHGHSIQVTAILCGKPVDKWWAPNFAKTSPMGQGCKAVEARSDEYGIALCILMDVMDVNIARRMTADRHIKCIIAILYLAGIKEVFEPPKLAN